MTSPQSMLTDLDSFGEADLSSVYHTEGGRVVLMRDLVSAASAHLSAGGTKTGLVVAHGLAEIAAKELPYPASDGAWRVAEAIKTVIDALPPTPSGEEQKEDEDGRTRSTNLRGRDDGDVPSDQLGDSVDIPVAGDVALALDSAKIQPAPATIEDEKYELIDGDPRDLRNKEFEK